MGKKVTSWIRRTNGLGGRRGEIINKRFWISEFQFAKKKKKLYLLTFVAWFFYCWNENKEKGTKDKKEY